MGEGIVSNAGKKKKKLTPKIDWENTEYCILAVTFPVIQK